MDIELSSLFGGNDVSSGGDKCGAGGCVGSLCGKAYDANGLMEIAPFVQGDPLGVK